MRVLFVLYEQAGHFRPLSAVMKQLQARGHTLACYCPQDPSSQLAAAGIDAVGFGEPVRAGGGANGVELTRRLGDVRWAERFLRMAVLEPLPRQVAAITAAIRTFRPDVVAVEPMLYAGAIAASREDVPWAALATTLEFAAPPSWAAANREVFARLAPQRAAAIAPFGVDLAFRASDAVSPWLNTVFTTEAFLPRAAAENEGVFFVGPAISSSDGEQPFAWECDRPMVYVSFGSVVLPPVPVLVGLCDALGARGVHVVIAAKEAVDQVAWPAHVTALRWVPQVQALSHAAAMISQGGAASIADCLRAGRSPLVVPMAHDQQLAARAVVESGCGWTVPLDELLTATGQRLLDRLVDPSAPERARAREIGASFRRHDGGVATAELLETLARTRQPLSPARREGPPSLLL